jgi:hypothetical protein
MAPTNGSYINDADHKLRSMRHSGQLEVLIVRRAENIRADKLGCGVSNDQNNLLALLQLN